jgi:predicted  nucleic acid-binding Zn-ribbon protein
MPATAQNLRDLHELHQRAKTIRDLMTSAPKTLAAREAGLAKKNTEMEAAREALKRAKADMKNKEVQAQGIRNKVDELRVRLNAIKKQAEYDAIRNEIAHGNNNASKIEDEVLELMSKVETQEADLKVLNAEVAKMTGDVAALAADIQSKTGEHQAQLQELDDAIVAAEAIIPEEMRDQYRRVIKQRGADAMAPVEDNACHGCYVTVTSQTMNELINAHILVFCKICGRILYLAEETHNALKRK